jgi:hypothetical protein
MDRDGGEVVKPGNGAEEEPSDAADLQRARMPEREALRPASSTGRMGRLEASQSGCRRGLSGRLAGDPQASPGRGATLPVLRGQGQRGRSHPARLTRRDA